MTVSPAMAETLSGPGLITGLPATVRLEPASAGHGVVFYLEERFPVPARLESVVHTERGVTLACRQTGKTLSIVEHFLAACALAGVTDLKVFVSGAPELPILDGSAAPWLAHLSETIGRQPVEADLPLEEAIYYEEGEEIRLYALPAERFQLTYGVNFNHPDLQSRWIRWRPQDGPEMLAPARTFGFVSELPLLQAKGLAKGVSEENTLGLYESGGYTGELRLPDEPVRHKALDLLGDFMLTGMNPLRLQAHVFAINAGHGAHTAFAGFLSKAVKPGRPHSGHSQKSDPINPGAR